MEKSLNRILKGYQLFSEKYALGDRSVMQHLSRFGQQPEIMVVACCDARVDPALILQCEPGDLFVVRNVANIVPPYQNDAVRHDTSAALEFGVSFLKVKHLILLGHSQCGGIHALLNFDESNQNDFITNWVSQIKVDKSIIENPDDCARLALQQSYENCMTFPWIKEKVINGTLIIHLWFFDIKTGHILTYSDTHKTYQPLAS